jgi:hypothetical protein
MIPIYGCSTSLANYDGLPQLPNRMSKPFTCCGSLFYSGDRLFATLGRAKGDRNMGVRNHAGWLATVCGVALAAGMQVAPSAAASPITDWGAQALGPATEIKNGIVTLKTSANAVNLDRVKAACLQLQGSAEDLRSILPAPSQALTDEVSAALSELRMATRSCAGLGPSGRPGGRSVLPDRNEISSAEMHLDKAVVHMENAKSMVERG